MLPNVTLKGVSLDDIDRIGWWLQDDEISSRWFGHYACGDPVHRGYDPERMLEASQTEWDRVFNDPFRRILSIYNEDRDHIGECFVSLDGHGGAELSLLIGRKELWHHGYGTATVIELLDRVLDADGPDRVWVSIPEDNTAARGLFEKFGFVPEASKELCKGRDGVPHRAAILALDYNFYRARQSSVRSRNERAPVVTVTGLPGSGSDEVAERIAALLGGRVVDDEIADRLQKRLRCSQGELGALKHSVVSRWSRLLRAIVVPVAWPASYEAGHYWPGSDLLHEGVIVEETVTRKQYLEALSGVISQLAVEGNVVFHGHGSHLFVPDRISSLNVFVSASPELRARTIAVAHGLSVEEADDFLNEADRDEKELCKNLLGGDLLDMGGYDLTLNLDRLSVDAAAQVVVGALTLAPAPPNRRVEAASPFGAR